MPLEGLFNGTATDRPGEWSAARAVCPQCSVQVDARVRVLVRFPEDAETVIDLAHGRLNAFRCPVCGHVGHVMSDVTLFRAGAEALCAPASELGEPVRAWLTGYVRAALAALDPQGSGVEWTEAGIPRAHSPLTLLALTEQAEQAEAGLPVSLSEVLPVLVRHLLGSAYTFAFHHGGLGRLPALLADRLPRRCLMGPVLAAVAEEPAADPWHGDIADPMAWLDRTFRAEYLCAVAHAHAQVPNPRAAEWTDLCWNLFRVRRRDPGFFGPDGLLPDAAALAATIPFPDAWNVYAVALREDRELIKVFSDWFTHVGRLAEAVRQMEGGGIGGGVSRFPDDAELVREVRRSLHEGLDDAGWDDPVVVRLASMMCQRLLAAGRLEAAVALVVALCEDVVAAEAWSTLGHLVVSACAALNHVMRHDDACDLLRRYAPRVLRHTSDPHLWQHLANERGNALRHTGRAAEAVAVYESALRRVPDGFPSGNLAVLRRNHAIALRESGRFATAVAILRELSDDPDADHSHRVVTALSLALALLEMNRDADALAALEAAARIPLGPADTYERLRLLVCLLLVRATTARDPRFPELTEALTLATPASGMYHAVRGIALRCARYGPVPDDLLAEAMAAVDRLLDPVNDSPPVTPGQRVAVLLEGVQWHLWCGDRAHALRLAAPLRTAAAAGILPWDAQWTLARLDDPPTPARRWAAMRRVLMALDRATPGEAEDVRTAAAWLADKDEIQREIATAAADGLAAGVVPPAEALAAFEFLNGREIRTRSGSVARAANALLTARTHGAPGVLVAFLESPRGLALLICREDGNVTHVPWELDPDRLTRARQHFERRVGGGCLLPRQAAAVLDPLRPLLSELARHLTGHIARGEQLCFLPSATILGLPLHAAELADGSPLLERNPISYAPNSAVLEATLTPGRLPRPGQGPAVCFCVPKSGDRATLARQFASTAGLLRDRFGPSLTVRAELAASRGEFVSSLPAAQHLVVLAHGANSTAEAGRGICLSDGASLPPAPLPVKHVPELRRFLVDGDDIAAAQVAPPVVVSLACSSGRTFAGRGGSRIGLERALFSRGTRTIVAPLWDVNAESAAAFVGLLYDRWCAAPDMPLGEHYRAAALAVRELYPAPFHWAPFALRGSWL